MGFTQLNIFFVKFSFGLKKKTPHPRKKGMFIDFRERERERKREGEGEGENHRCEEKY